MKICKGEGYLDFLKKTLQRLTLRTITPLLLGFFVGQISNYGIKYIHWNEAIFLVVIFEIANIAALSIYYLILKYKKESI